MESVHGKANIQAIICIIIEPRKENKKYRNRDRTGDLWIFSLTLFLLSKVIGSASILRNSETGYWRPQFRYRAVFFSQDATLSVI